MTSLPDDLLRIADDLGNGLGRDRATIRLAAQALRTLEADRDALAERVSNLSGRLGNAMSKLKHPDFHVNKGDMRCRKELGMARKARDDAARSLTKAIGLISAQWHAHDAALAVQDSRVTCGCAWCAKVSDYMEKIGASQ